MTKKTLQKLFRLRPSFVCAIIGLTISSCQFLMQEDKIRPELTTESDLVVAFSDLGEVRSVMVGELAFTITTFMRAHSGWLIEDKMSGKSANFRGRLIPVEENVLIQKGTIDELGLEIECRYEVVGEIIKAACIISSTILEDRALDATFRLPVIERNWKWEGGIDERIDILAHQTYQGDYVTLPQPDSTLFLNRYTGTLSLYPYSGISNPEYGIAITYAIPPTNLINYKIWYETQLYRASFHIGLSPDHSEPNRASINFAIIPYDTEWGYRSAIEKYHSLYREYFVPDTMYKGLMRIGGSEQPVDGRNFGSHILGGDIYSANSREEYFQQSGAISDRSRGEMVFPYITIGQRQIFDIESVPRTEDEALDIFENWSTPDVFFYQSPQPDNSYQSVDQLKEIIRNSNIYTPGQEPALFTRPFWRSRVITFPLNPDYHLFLSQDSMTVSKYTGDVYLPEIIRPADQVSGIYVSSLSEWGRFYNFRHDHFHDSYFPLTYHPDSLYVCLPNTYSQSQYLDTLRAQTGTTGHVLVTGGIRPGDQAYALRGDYIETDLSHQELKDFKLLRWFRIICGPKPVFVKWPEAINNIDEVEDQWNFCLAMGYFPNFGTKFIVQSPLDSVIVERRMQYTPVLNSLNHAQWQPIPHAWISNDSLSIQRFGRSASTGLYYTVYNPQSKAAGGILSINLRVLRLSAAARIENVLQPGLRLSLHIDSEGRINTGVNLPPYGINVFRVTN